MPSQAHTDRIANMTPKKSRPQASINLENNTTPKKKAPEFSTPRKIKITTPQKHSGKAFSTPQKEHGVQAESPRVHSTPTASPMGVQEVGPTPQMSGRVLGIFDAQTLSPFGTPTKSSQSVEIFSAANSGSLEDCPAISTPKSNKRKLDDLRDSIPHTPQSHFSTPIQSPSKGQDAVAATPKYFHQSSIVIDDYMSGTDTDSDDDVPMGRQRAKRGLSNIIAELREIKDRQLDDEEDIMRQMEMENENFDPDMLGEVQGDADELNPEKPEGFKVYKKKGQKRTTRRHVFRPNEPTSNGLDDCTEISQKPSRPSKPQANFKRLKLHNSGFKGKPNYFKRRR